MKILQICNFSSGISGVWTRALEDSREFMKRGHEVYVFSSDVDEIGNEVSSEEELEGIKIRRFPVKRKYGYALWFDFENEAKELKPDVIICHGLRKPYLGPAIGVSKHLGIKCFLITHAPFIDKKLRTPGLNLAIWFYDKFLGKAIMNSFDKVIAICKWEKKVLLELGCEEKRIIYIPNSISDDFFNPPVLGEEKKIIYMGRMHPVKRIEDLIRAFNESNIDNYIAEVVSSKKGEYYQSLVVLRDSKPETKGNIIFTEPIYNPGEKVMKIDTAKIFVLPSDKESLPFGLIEAMARGKMIIATRTLGAEEIIEDKKNGFLMEIGDIKGLSKLIENIDKLPIEEKNRIMVAAKRKAEEFKISNIMEKWDGLFKDETKA
jgi:glycosyltransferase involved in cell wall biosynthesis